MLRPLTTFKALRLAFGKSPQPRVGQLRPPVVALLAARLAECEELELLLRAAGREPRPSDFGVPARSLSEIHADVAAYTELLSERLAWVGRTAGGVEDAGPSASSPDRVSLGVAVAAFAGGMRGGAEEAERLGDHESAALLAEIARVAETWLWYLDTPESAQDASGGSPTTPHGGTPMRMIRLLAALLVCHLALAGPPLAAQQKSLPEQIADVMVQLNGGIHTGYRFAHAKGLVLTGTFTPAPSARTISRAAHLTGPGVPVTVRLSDGTGVPQINDDNPNAAPRGMAIRFTLPKGGFTDIVANSHNGFFVGTGEDFLAFLKAVAATTPTSPHPSPIEQFLGAHPRALKVITDSRPLPKSFANLAFYGNNAFTFVDSAGTRRIGRYQILPVAGAAELDSVAASKVTPNYLFDELRARVGKAPIAYRLYVQLADPGDQTNDGSIVWPSSRKRVELGTLKLAAVAPDNDRLQQTLTFNPIYLTDGIQLSDDPFVPLRSAVYALSVRHRR